LREKKGCLRFGTLATVRWESLTSDGKKFQKKGLRGAVILYERDDQGGQRGLGPRKGGDIGGGRNKAVKGQRGRDWVFILCALGEGKMGKKGETRRARSTSPWATPPTNSLIPRVRGGKGEEVSILAFLGDGGKHRRRMLFSFSQDEGKPKNGGRVTRGKERKVPLRDRRGGGGRVPLCTLPLKCCARFGKGGLSCRQGRYPSLSRGAKNVGTNSVKEFRSTLPGDRSRRWLGRGVS